jgi:hypothetical protein
MRKVFVYSGSGIPFKKGKPGSIISEDIDGFLRSLMKDQDIEFHIPLNKEEDCPDYYQWFNMKKPIEEWNLSEFDEIIVTGSNLGLFGGVLDVPTVGFIHGLKTFSGRGSLFFTDTTLPEFSIMSKLYERMFKKGKKHGGLICDLDLDKYLTEDDFKAALQFEKNIDHCYTNFYNYKNEFTKKYSEVTFTDGFRTALTARSYDDGGLFAKTHDQLIPKACYIGNYKGKRVRRLKKMGIYDTEFVDWYGKVGRDLDTTEKPKAVNIDQVVPTYKNYMAAIVVIDPEMWDLGIPHRWIQSALIGVPTFIDANIAKSIKFNFNEKFLKFIQIANKRDLKSRLEKLQDEEFYTNFMKLQNAELKRFISADINEICFE